MKILRLLLYASISFIASSILILLLGSGGLLEYRSLLAYREDLEENILELKKTNEELRTRLDTIRSKSESIILQARELGYLREDEGIIRVEGLQSGKSYYMVGRIIRRIQGGERKNWVFKLLGFSIFLILSAMFLLRRRKKRHAGPS